jgi:osmotically-inducible protein OsmY
MNISNRKLLLATAVTLALASMPVVATDRADKTPLGAIAEARQEAQIWTTYALSPYLRANDIGVVVVNGKATLNGSVEEDVHKDLAGAIAAGVSGIKDVDNQIKVDADYQTPVPGSARGYGDVVDDVTITTAVKSKLLWSKHTEGMDTKVVTYNGRVELSGTVATPQAKQQAEKLAKNTDGVRSVDNKLLVSDKAGAGKAEGKDDAEKGTVIADTWITTKVKSTFLYSSNVAGSDISVNTDKGIVTLAGKVDSGIEQALAIELAQNIRGVKSVSSKALVF